jgi:N-acetylgalactosamine kinase
LKQPLPQHLTHKIREIYNCSTDELLLHSSRYERLFELFASAFPETNPTHVVRAPGRVNLIGEHTDYNGYPVLPMAFERDFIFVIAPTADGTVELVNEDPRFEPRTFGAMRPLAPYEQGDWGNYVKAAVNGILEEGRMKASSPSGFRAAVGGNIPESAGLSSSSALVVASALAFLAVNPVSFDSQQLAELLARAERYVGSEGGGMDQAVSLLAEADAALKIDFFPLRTEIVPLPKDVSFVVCNSLVRAPKSEETGYAYNLRVVECRLAAALLAKGVGQRTGKTLHPTPLLADLSPKKLKLDPAEVDRIALNVMGREPLSLADISRRLEVGIESIRNDYCRLKGGTFPEEPPDGFQLWKRYRHVVTEAHRVARSADALRNGNVQMFARLMNESHVSCRENYEISTTELDLLVSLAREHGALGARLTGAGFGGCTVNAVKAGDTESFIRTMRDEYYDGLVRRHPERHFIEVENPADRIFRCQASSGARVLPLR